MLSGEEKILPRYGCGATLTTAPGGPLDELTGPSPMVLTAGGPPNDRACHSRGRPCGFHARGLSLCALDPHSAFA